MWKLIDYESAIDLKLISITSRISPRITEKLLLHWNSWAWTCFTTYYGRCYLASYGISNDFDNPNKRRSYWLLNPPLTFSFCLKPIVTREILGILLHIGYLWSRCWYSRCFGNDPERKKIFRQIDISKSVMFTVT